MHLMYTDCIDLANSKPKVMANSVVKVAPYPGPRMEHGKGPGDTWQNSCMC